MHTYIHIYINTYIDCVWNVMVHAQKPDFVFRRNGRVHLNRRGASVQSTTYSRGVRISGSNAGYTTFRASVKGAGYPFHSPSLPLPSVTVCHHISTGHNVRISTKCLQKKNLFSGASSLPYLSWLNFNVNRDYHDSHPVCIVLYLVFPVNGQRRVFADLGSGSVDSSFQELVFMTASRSRM